MKRTLTGLFEEFTKNEQASGYILLACTLLSLGIANSPLGTAYAGFWRLKFGTTAGHIHLDHSLLEWINEGLMAVFFLLVGLEMKRELSIGELSGARRASLPLFAALGGMLAPALIHFGLNRGTATQAGFGIPMATDIAFAIGLLAILGDRIPVALKVFLVALAIIDDLGSILVIAFFYSEQVSAVYVALALATFLGMILMNRLGVVHLAA